MWWIRSREIADEDGNGTGKWRLTARSDEPVSGPFGLCDHEHDTSDEADQCPDALAQAETIG